MTSESKEVQKPGFWEELLKLCPCVSSAAVDISSPSRMTSNQEIFDESPNEYEDIAESPLPFSKLIIRAESGDPESQLYVALAYLKGKGVDKSLERALEWLEKAKSLDNPEASFELGKLYERGRIGGGSNPKKAWECFSISADLDHAGARTKIGEYYEKGWVVKKDKKKAVANYIIGAKLGNSIAQYRLGRCYEEGIGTAKRESEAVVWYQKAASAGHARAMYFLGYMYETGRGGLGDPDMIRAISLYKDGAKQNEPNCLYRLGVCFEHGKHFPKNLTKAKQFYEKAAAARHPDAEERLKEIALLTSSPRTAAELEQSYSESSLLLSS